jgi:hypothetical protein
MVLLVQDPLHVELKMLTWEKSTEGNWWRKRHPMMGGAWILEGAGSNLLP